MDAEVCVVGGGPAGATVAARLATLGHDVVLVERAAFPREHLGESLSPGVWPLLGALGVGEVPCLRPPSRVRWGGVERIRPAGEGGATVDRGAFDALLLRHAAECGVRVQEPALATVARVGASPGARAGGGPRAPQGARGGDGLAAPRGAPAESEVAACGGAWEVTVRGAAGARTVVRAAFVVDSAGRRGVLGGGRRFASSRMLCLHARWRGAAAPDTLVEERPDCWLWGAPLPDGTFRAMAFVDAGRLRSRGVGRAALPAHYRLLLTGSELLAAVARDGSIEGRVGACDATCSVARHVVDARSIRVGEAAFAIDPLSSSGVQLAIQTALSAATAVHTILAPELDSAPAIEFYAEQVSHAAARHGRLAAAFYADGPRASSFWRSRAGEPEPAGRGGGPALDDLLAHPVRLARGATLADTPCVVGDRIERRPALAHAALDRPVAYLGGHELAPLVELARAAPSLRAAIAGWCAAGLAPPTAEAVARWLVGHGVIERAG